MAHEFAALVVFVTGTPEQIPGALGAITKPWDPTTLEQLITFVRACMSTPRTPAGAPPKMMIAPSLRDNVMWCWQPRF
ncbi:MULTISPECIES: hypothetical protein [unclassified Mesorhizobium]|uniref:hypothetical protein n=1 Tax=unclassified Mesorhizobium TaxID=325217 RepID=UPI000FCACF33|nr:MULTISPECIES: hypothetical protein [unclassified Mesorhizobium]RUU68100.1 hypothetical protein EOC99_00645 [Mesorhizobium sp. M7A.T.Ca.TU.009.01.1.1]RUU90200.1 hypothetical protein EOD03_01900 [Mesorhizobium sp. M7A.T.Ca.TU.009.01.1.2]RUV53846.1 hypothetical protein EOB77_00060 [Mesorhizobium sp. M7A.F.Ca.MR.228.00.0.0]MDF3152972.1 hypothetical protein [Mesorhizobium sp. XAP10]MDF3245018.1 hypothetical protein [Mesorhizobium sp. XAP4]